MSAYRRLIELFPLRLVGEHRYSCTFTPALARPDGGLYGGSGLGLAVAAGERATGRPCRWCTVQHLGPAAIGEQITIDVHVDAVGRSVSQLRVSACIAGRPLFNALAAHAEPRRTDLAATFAEFPAVTSPEDSPVLMAARRHDEGTPNMLSMVEVRQALPLTPIDHDERFAVWVRLHDIAPRAPVLGYLSDWVAPEVLRRMHRTGGGMSLDTTLRLGAVDVTEWVLVEMRADMVVSGFGTGSVLMWSANRTLVAVAEQTAVLRPAD